MRDGGTQPDVEPARSHLPRRASRAMFSAVLSVFSLVVLKVAEAWIVGHEMTAPFVIFCFVLFGISAVASAMSFAFGIAALRPGQKQRWWLVITAVILFIYLWPQLYSDFKVLVLGR